jgi:hypothetical protein
MKQHHHTTRSRRSREYLTWNSMIQRCTNPRSIGYRYYGGKGITVSSEWRDFRQFHKDMGPRPLRHTLERINNELGYSKDNCQWATRKTQSRNKSDNRVLTASGESLCVSEWAEKLGVPHDRIRSRLRNGWSIERVLFTPPLHPPTNQRDTLKESIKVAQQRKGVAA